MPNQHRKKIFISHASADSEIGEKLLDALVDLGVDKNEVFYSSLYHTGVKLGADFHNIVKAALNEAEIVVFLLTQSFYQSEYCLNEMGAVWLNNIHFVPILLNGITYRDMKGFIDSRYIAFTPEKNETYKIIKELRPFITKGSNIKDLEHVFDDFIVSANNMAAKNVQYLPDMNNPLSRTEQMILTGRFTDDEILLMQHFANIGTNILSDVNIYDPSTCQSEHSAELDSIIKYAQEYTFNYINAKTLLEQSKLLKYEYDWEYSSEEYQGARLNIDVFRDFISLSNTGKLYVEEVLARHTLAPSKEKVLDKRTIQLTTQPKRNTTLESIILSPKFKELEALLLCYVLDTSINSLGDRWMEEITVKNIKLWEDMNNLNNTLSRGYADALNMFKFRNLIDVASVTSYGNPREFKIKDEFYIQLKKLSLEAGKVLENVKSNNVDDEELPF